MSTTPEKRELLLKDFDHFAESFWRNEALGESRFNFYLGIVGAVFAGMGALASDKASLSLRPFAELFALACGGLFCVGLLTLMRICHRNRVSSGYLAVLRAIREELADPALVARYSLGLVRDGRSFTNGGLAHQVAVVNAGVFGIACWFAAGPSLDLEDLVLPALGAIVAGGAQAWWIGHAAQTPKNATDAPGLYPDASV